MAVMPMAGPNHTGFQALSIVAGYLHCAADAVAGAA